MAYSYKMATEVDHYVILGLPSGEEGARLTQKDIAKAYKAKALQLHPDKCPGDPTAHVAFLKVQKSYDVLKDDKSRVCFDNNLKKLRELELQRKRAELAEKQRLARLAREKAREEEERVARLAREEEERVAKLAREEAERIARRPKDEIAKVRSMYGRWRGLQDDFSSGCFSTRRTRGLFDEEDDFVSSVSFSKTKTRGLFGEEEED